MQWAPAREAGVRVVREADGGIVRGVLLLDEEGDEVEPVNRFLSHLIDANYSPNTVCAYAYDLRHLAVFLDARSLGWNDFGPATALELLGYLRRVPSRRPAQRLGLKVATEQGRLLSAATVQRVLAATSSFFEWAIAAEYYTAGENPMQRRVDHALGRVPDRHLPFVGAVSRLAVADRGAVDPWGAQAGELLSSHRAGGKSAVRDATGASRVRRQGNLLRRGVEAARADVASGRLGGSVPVRARERRRFRRGEEPGFSSSSQAQGRERCRG